MKRAGQTGINTKAVAANQPLIHAALQNDLEQMSEQAALAETAMPVLRECRMVWHRISQIQFAKPAIRQIDMDLLAKPPLGSNALAIAQQRHADHQFGINRRTTIGTVVWSK